MSLVELQNLSDMEILQMILDNLQKQYLTLEELKQKRTNVPTFRAPMRDESSLLGKLEEAFEENTTAPKEKPHKKGTRTKNSYPPEILPNGIELAKTRCRLYAKKPQYKGNGRVLIYNNTCRLSITQLIDLSRNFDKVPKKGQGVRMRWAKNRYGKEVSTFDCICYNMAHNQFDEAFKQYYEMNYKINFDKDGSIKKGE